MGNPPFLSSLPSTVFGFLFTIIITLLASSHVMAGNSPEYIAEGKQLAFDRKKGNCLACHAIDDGSLAGNSGPPLLAMKARFPDKGKLYEQIADPTIRNPNSLMPPFGRHGILSKDEIEKIMAYLLTL